VTGCANPPSPWVSGRWIDLTHPFSGETIYWPTAEPFRLEPVFQGVTEKGFYYTANAYCAAEHGGTHVDAPIHFASGGPTVDQIGLPQLIGRAVAIDVSAKALADRDYRVSVSDVVNWEREHGRIPPNSIVLLRTGFDRYWPDPLKYLGTKERGTAAVAQLHFPGLHPEAARWLAEQRRIKAVGLDTASIDYGQSALFQSHRVLSRARIPIFENVAQLEQVPATGAWVVALPMKIRGGSGAPLRLVTWVP
jgi:kynurenine formamidase